MVMCKGSTLMQIAQPRGAVFLLPCSFLFLIAWQVDEQGRIGSVECDGKFSCKPACKGKLQMDLLIAIKSALRPALEGFLQPVCFVLRFLLWLVLVACIGGADSLMQFHSWVTQSFRARPVSQPTRMERRSSFAEGAKASAEPRGPI